MITEKSEAKTQLEKEQNKDSLISYWDVQRKGANYFNVVPRREWFKAAQQANIKLVRFTYEKWRGEGSDFLLGSADNYTSLVKTDYEKLKKYLDIAEEFGIKIVLTPLSLPGARYTQTNGMKRDGRLWQNKEYLSQAIKFWRDLASLLKDHPAIVGYTLINEPFPEWFYGKKTFWDGNFSLWYKTVKGSAGDLNNFNQKIVEGIREVDTETPIVIETGLYATPWAIEYLTPLNDKKIIYSFHMYEPYQYTTKKINKGMYTYPGELKLEDTGSVFIMNKKSLQQFFDPVRKWAKKHKISAERIWVSEFGADRTMPGVTQYLHDLIEIFNSEGWHWAFYSFREDEWSSMDYELGTTKPFWKYWDYQQDKTLHLHYDEIYEKVKDRSLWLLFLAEFVLDSTQEN